MLWLRPQISEFSGIQWFRDRDREMRVVTVAGSGFPRANVVVVEALYIWR